MSNREFFEKLPIVLDCLKEAITNEIGNNYDFNYNSYDDLIDKEVMFDLDVIETFKEYADAIDSIEEDYGQLEICTKTILKALDDYGKGGYKFIEDGEGFEFDETPFENKQEMNDFIEYLENRYETGTI